MIEAKDLKLGKVFWRVIKGIKSDNTLKKCSGVQKISLKEVEPVHYYYYIINPDTQKDLGYLAKNEKRSFVKDLFYTEEEAICEWNSYLENSVKIKIEKDFDYCLSALDAKTNKIMALLSEIEKDLGTLQPLDYDHTIELLDKGSSITLGYSGLFSYYPLEIYRKSISELNSSINLLEFQKINSPFCSRPEFLYLYKIMLIKEKDTYCIRTKELSFGRVENNILKSKELLKEPLLAKGMDLYYNSLITLENIEDHRKELKNLVTKHKLVLSKGLENLEKTIDSYKK